MKKGLLSLLLISTCILVRAQQLPLVVRLENGKLFLNHTVSAKENWYSVGRLYNISPKDLAPYNNTTIDKGLSIGQALRIPLEAGNFTQTGGGQADEALVPVHHVVEPKEGLYHISQSYNKVPMDNIRSWNHLSSDNLHTGMSLVIGYLKVKKDQSVLASAATQTNLQPVKTEHKAPAVTPPPVETTVPKADTKPATQPSKPLQEPAPVTTAPVQSTNPGNGGAFKSQYDDQSHNGAVNTQTGPGAVFKSTSGWKDAKYYALMNKATPGTIIRVTNPANNRIIYAKVLGEIPPGKENEGLFIRISNAAASELALAESAKADLQISWVK